MYSMAGFREYPGGLQVLAYTLVLQTHFFLSQCDDSVSANDLASRVQQALSFVEAVRTGPCDGGTDNTLPVDFDHSPWEDHAMVAVRMANQLTKIIVQSSNNTLWTASQEFLFNLVRTNVDDDSLIFGSAIAVEPYIFPQFEKFSPYSWKKTYVYVKDLSLGYDYLHNSTEWYHTLRIIDWENATVTMNLATYRYNNTASYPEEELYQPMSVLEDGHWTRPYFDCGGGDIWMVTYSSPIFGMIPEGRIPIFRGIATIDIELTNIDINQCDADERFTSDESTVDVFRGTHKCPESTRCEPVAGEGFVVGAYLCYCADGFYFPDTTADPPAYNGTEIESLFSNVTNETAEVSANLNSLFTCLPCAEGCVTCVDDSPCLYSYLAYVRTPLLILTLVLLGFICLVSIGVTFFRDRRAIKSASPIFLHTMTAGAALMALPLVIMFQEPSAFICTLTIWPQHLGYALLYGALLLKTWRISVIFKVKSARKVALTDRILAKYLLAIVLVAIAYLIVWTFLGKPDVEWLYTSSDLKFLACSTSTWGIGAIIAESLFLLWGAYLCYSVRKAPSHFNESKYITWGIYNYILLGTFILIIRQFIALPQGPDVIYAVDFIYIQIGVTGTMCLIFIPKFAMVGLGSGGGEDAEDNNASITGRAKTKAAAKTETDDPDSVVKEDAEVQTLLTGVDVTLPEDIVSYGENDPKSGCSLSRRGNKVAPQELQG